MFYINYNKNKIINYNKNIINHLKIYFYLNKNDKNK